tara:strand:- start:9326 stop:9949 length:624 start_codon:yes stop_codon:yes gene_type:complete
MGTYCTVADVSDFLRVPITATTTPNKAQVEKIITRKEDELDRRIGHTFGRNKTSEEIHDLPLLYTYGWGTPLYLKHRNCRDLDYDSGDRLSVWSGAGGQYDDILQDSTDQWYEFEPLYGRIFMRGYIFTILRKNRIKIKYRYGDADVPSDVSDACIKLVAIDLLNSSFRMDILPVGSNGADLQMSKSDWRADIENCIENRQEFFFIP